MRPVLLVGGAPRVKIDAVRFLSVHATGRTAVHLAETLADGGCHADLLLSIDAQPGVSARRYADRSQLEAQLQGWITEHAQGVVVMSAAINDYQLAQVEVISQGVTRNIANDGKAPSGFDEMVIHLRPATKVIDQLRGWGLKGPLIAFKYEDRGTVLTAAEALRQRVGATVVVANSLCDHLQALVDGSGVLHAADRRELLEVLTRRILALAGDSGRGN